MFPIISAAFALYLAFDYYQQAKRAGSWSWRKFFAIIGSVAVFTAGFIYPLANIATHEDDPTWPVTILLVGIVVVSVRNHK